ncbi:MAG: cation-transporting P-type ATPase [Actinomycetota bacterium]|nr:cation-transporting P-type ATPase [Actinomycetota bacterium]
MSQQEAEERLQEYGHNQLPSKKAVTIWRVILNQVKSPLIYILLTAAVVSMVVGEIKDAVFIFFVIILNSGLGTYQEYRAEKSAQSLESYLERLARVTRGGDEKSLNARYLVPGDIVSLQPATVFRQI